MTLAPGPSFTRNNFVVNLIQFKDGSPDLAVMGGDSCCNGRGFESQHHRLDGHFSHSFVVIIVMFI